MGSAALALLDRNVAQPLCGFLDCLYRLNRLVARYPANLLHYIGVKANHVTLVRYFSPLILLYAVPAINSALTLPTLFALSYSDTLDGVLAEIEKKGKNKIDGIFESVADKVLIITAYYIFSQPFPSLFWATLIGEALSLLLAAGYFIVAVDEKEKKTDATIWGKTKMALEVAAACLMVVYSRTGTPWLNPVITIIGSLALVFLFLSISSKVREISL